jgi:hypothetical protein
MTMRLSNHIRGVLKTFGLLPGAMRGTIAKRSGNGKVRVALARKLSVILHSVWRSGEPFRWSEHARAA